MILLFKPWRGGRRQLNAEDCISAICLPVLLILEQKKTSLLFETPVSMMSLLTLLYTVYLLDSKYRWPSASNPRIIITVIMGVLVLPYTFMGEHIVQAATISLLGVSTLSFLHYILEIAWHHFRTSFTGGEVLIICQAASLILFSTIIDIITRSSNLVTGADLYREENSLVLFSKVAVLSAAFLMLTTIERPEKFYRNLFVIACSAVTLLVFVSDTDAIVSILRFVCSPQHTWLLCYWLMVTCSCLPVIYYYRLPTEAMSTLDGTSLTPPIDEPCDNSRWKLPNTVTRKFFHLVILAIFVPGLCLNVSLLYLASMAAMTGLLVIEMMRMHCVPPCGRLLTQLFDSFRDHQDSGKLITTPLYLLSACSLPLWLNGPVMTSERAPIALFLGLASIGVGDAASSIIGTWIGKHSLCGGKSIEGCLAGFLSQVLFMLLMVCCGLVVMETSDVVLPVVLAISSLTEAITSQVDNLVVPIYTMLSHSLLSALVRCFLAN